MLHPNTIAPHSASWRGDLSSRLTEASYGSPGFGAQLESILRRLSINRLRFSLVRLILPSDAMEEAAVVTRILQHLADPYVMAGLWHDGSIVAAFLGPRGQGSAGDNAQAYKIVRRCRDAIAEAGQVELIPQSTLLVAHRWTDEVLDIASLVEAMSMPGGMVRGGCTRGSDIGRENSPRRNAVGGMAA